MPLQRLAHRLGPEQAFSPSHPSPFGTQKGWAVLTLVDLDSLLANLMHSDKLAALRMYPGLVPSTLC